MEKNYKIQKLPKEKWKGTMLNISYRSEEYYDLSINRKKNGFSVPIEKKKFDKPFIHRVEDSDYPDRLYEDWWENAEAYGIVKNDVLLAAIEICPEEWSNRLLITELFVDESIRKQGYGKMLLNYAKDLATKRGNRVLMLETQTSNVNAVDFYLHEGFTLIGFDSCCYTNEDLDRKEVRLNLGWFPG